METKKSHKVNVSIAFLVLTSGSEVW